WECVLQSCLYSSTNPSALGLGVCAAIFLVMAQVTVTAVGGCCGCCKSRAIPSETKRIVGVVCAVISW
ncbi:Os05g0433800, partial [Oryza sativa Japonica Group]